MSFDVPADAYVRFMGRYSTPLAGEFAALAGEPTGARVLDVGCGPGMLSEVLVADHGEDRVAAIDPAAAFVEATRVRFPRADVRQGPAEALPWDDDSFGASLAQLVVPFMSDPVAGLREMGRVTRPGGIVAACVWDHADGGGGPLSPFWTAAHALDPDAPSEAGLAGAREGHLAELAAGAGLSDIELSALTVRVPFSSYDEWWAPYLLGVGPPGSYVATLDPAARARLEQRCREELPDPPFEQPATAWCVRARA